ncbi:hypothetical protein DPMN_127020 [Dreissena polymorpha]|uniref:Uncharacterized protein n=1 Tax=Dreissena polymorpha TaxID=45954 RepID=A0A9D4GYE4_DREPO|nr:hypothetical protein DPMN_127020 [Dreissena polymorpha]
MGNVVKSKHDDQRDYIARCLELSVLFQRMIIAGCIEAEVSGQTEMCLQCRDFTFYDYLNYMDSKALKTLLMLNKSDVRSLILERNVLQTSEILIVLQHSTVSLKRVKTTVTPEINKALQQTSIEELHCIGKIDVPSLSLVLPSLSYLTYLHIEESTFKDKIVLPDTVKHFSLFTCTCNSVFLQRLLLHLSSFKHDVQCDLRLVSATDCNTHLFESEILASDMSNITLSVKQGNTELYGLLRCTSIGKLALLTDDDVALASNILSTLSKIKQLYLHGTL